MGIARLLKRLSPHPSADTVPAPEDPVCVIGDVHGRDDLLCQLLDRLGQEPDAARTRLVLVGDLIDRGPQGAAVLARVQALTATPGPFATVTCLMGNHERMMLDFLANPVRHGARWLNNGGDTTLQSYGINVNAPPRRAAMAGNGAKIRLTGLRDALDQRLPPGLGAWLAALPLIWHEGALAVTHAGADPGRPITAQPADALLWGHPAFYRQRRRDGVWIAHGHVIVPDARAATGRIAVDTGAWRTGCLTAALLDANAVRFVSTATPAAV